jgi:hypothetical protein
MALHSFLGIQLGVPAPAELAAFYEGLGLVGGDARWGTADCPDQIEIVEHPYRQLLTMRIGCETEADLAALERRLDALGVSATRSAGRIACLDPSGTWRIQVEVAPRLELTPPPARMVNRPGERARSIARADAVTEAEARPPRRLGHVVLGSPDPQGTAKFFMEGIGFRKSDVVGGMLTFMRCSTDHHNLLVMPAPVPYLNHYALEHDDVDAVGAAASRYLEGREERHIVGIGRHVVGSNVFWYMSDPCGTMFEFFCDMDDIPDDDAWVPGTDWGFDDFSAWGPKEPPPEFIVPADIDDLARAHEAMAGSR